MHCLIGVYSLMVIITTWFFTPLLYPQPQWPVIYQTFYYFALYRSLNQRMSLPVTCIWENFYTKSCFKMIKEDNLDAIDFISHLTETGNFRSLRFGELQNGWDTGSFYRTRNKEPGRENRKCLICWGHIIKLFWGKKE